MIRAATSTDPRRETTRIFSPWPIPSASASAAEISAVSDPSRVLSFTAAGLGAGVVVVESSAGAEHEGILRVGHFGRRGPLQGGQIALAAGKFSAFVHDGRSGMIFIGHGPLQTVGFDTVIAYATENRRQGRHFVVPDLLAAGRWPFLSHAAGDLLENPPVGFCFTRRLDGLAHPADAPLGVGEGAVVLTPGRRRQNHMGKTGGLGFEDIIAHDKFRRAQAVLHMADIRLGIGDVFAEHVKRFDIAVFQSVDHIGDHQARCVGQLHPPSLAEFGSRRRP